MKLRVRKNTEPEDDAGLVQQALAGHHEAFTALVRRHQNRAHGVAMAMLSDFELARDVVQEAFFSAYRDLGKLREPSMFGPWLSGIVRHTSFRAIRELERVRRIAAELEPTLSPIDPAPSPDEQAQRTERRRQVECALDRLNDRSREVVTLHYMGGLSYAEIAAFLDVPESTVLGRLQRARAQLRKELVMVEKTFEEEHLPEDFADEVNRLLDIAGREGRERKRVLERLKQLGAPAVEPLCDVLDDVRATVRQHDVRAAMRQVAALALCGIGDPRAVRSIVGLLYRDDAWLFWRMCEDGHLLGVPGVRQALLEALDKGSPVCQMMAATALAHFDHDDEVYERIEAIAEHPATRGVAINAIQALCRIRPESTLEIIEQGLQSRDPWLRGRLARYAYQQNVLPSTKSCVRALATCAGYWDARQAGELILRHGPEGEETLVELMQSGSAHYRGRAAFTLAAHGHDAAFNVLKQAVLEGNETNRIWLKGATRLLIGRYGADIPSWNGRNMNQVHPAVWRWADGLSAESLQKMETLYREGAPAARAAAVRILARHRGTAFLPELRECLRAGKPARVARQALREMVRLGDAALPTVHEMLASEHWTERKAAACFLRETGGLEERERRTALNDPHPAVRAVAEG